MTHTLLLLALLSPAPDLVVTHHEEGPVSAGSVLPHVPHLTAAFPELPTGSLIFSQGDCLAVQIFTQSLFTHVGVVVRDGSQTMVYDAMHGHGVRKTPVEQYLNTLIPCDVHLALPVQPLTADEEARLRGHLERELGRPYSIRQHLTGAPCAGVHCSEYATEALIAAGRLTAVQPARVSPGSLREGLLAKGAFTDDGPYPFGPPLLPISAQETRCERWYRETAECCDNFCSFWNRSVLCRGE
jgi:hypothetical protein